MNDDDSTKISEISKTQTYPGNLSHFQKINIEDFLNDKDDDLDDSLEIDTTNIEIASFFNENNITLEYLQEKKIFRIF